MKHSLYIMYRAARHTLAQRATRRALLLLTLVAAITATLLLLSACTAQQLEPDPTAPIDPATLPADGRLAISRLDIATSATSATAPQADIAQGAQGAPATRIYTGAPTWEVGDAIRVTATAKATGAPIVGYYSYQEDGTWQQEDVWEDPNQNPEVVPADTYPLYIDDIDRTQTIRIDSWAGDICDQDLVNPDAHYYTDQGADIEGSYYHFNDHLAAPTATLHTAAPAAPGAPTRGSLTATLAHQRVDVVVRLITDAAHPIQMYPDGKPNNDLTLLHLALADGNSTGTDDATIRSWIEGMTDAAPDAPDAERGKSIVTFRAYVKPADLPAAGADGITPLGTLTYATRVDNNNDGTGTITLPGSGKLPLKYKLSDPSTPIKPGTRLTITIDFTRLTGLALSATVSPWTIEEGGEIITQPGRAEADGTQTLDPALFNAQRPVWIVNGGGNPETDAAVATNVKDALDALPAGTTPCIDLTMTGVKTVPKYAFPALTALTALHLPVAETIEMSAFVECTALATLSLPAATSIGQQAFYGCKALTTVSLPAATSIGEQAFYGCKALTTVSLPAATSFGQQAFYSCTALATVSLPRATSMGAFAFEGCTALATLSLPAATSIEQNAFQGCIKLATISLPVAQSIEQYAFFECAALKSLSLPAATTIGKDAFHNCAALATLSLPAATTIGQSAFEGCAALTSVSLPVAETIGESAFNGCATLTTLSLPAAQRIEFNAFKGCKALTSVSLPVAETIGINAFSDCVALTAISLPAATSIGNDAFSGCTTLATVSLPRATNFGGSAFQGCTALAALSLTAPGIFTLADNSFFGFPSTACALTLNDDKKAGISTGSPLVSGDSWGDATWISITHK